MRDLERSFQELGPSIARSFQTTVDDLRAKDAQILALIASQTAVEGADTSVAISNVQVAWTQAGQVTVTAPSWAANAVIVGIGVVGAINTTAAYMASLDARIVIGGSAALGVTLAWTQWASHSTNTGTVARTRVMAVTGGQVIPVRVDLQGTITGFTGDINISAIAVFTR